ncbi:DUF2141 domain-containing protein [Sphingomonas sp. AR_OL41]|jgi:uncharacterized protein (DUF2141 family)|uniref:DUF2141 domain-containing protein n=1 Tax=Sphingomonas sp. AR_OL41 TaxID=3042729 RepID=UPI0024808584|nr:DUF2141 domain-containing protein [Sphingomonas sp. AR_OL41]MDH7974084.1 DUF2141 domain-containing protein [Sphingomonas sp. AR_OL41]
MRIGARLAQRVTLGAAAMGLLVGATPTSELTIDVAKLRSSKGMIRICLTAAPDNFPSCVDDSQAVSRSVPAGTHDLRIGGLPYGGYAIAVIHDENNNKKLDTFMGIPREGFGFSRNPPIGFGAPRFAAARFAIAGDAETQQVVMRYLL